MTQPPKLSRCAVYTRKSTEHNLDLEFNSLDAQREACEAYIKSQAHEGWRLVPGHFDDGGISGASLERPALKALISEIEAGDVDVVVVYKVDRLTRSLTDFAKLVDLFDRHGVSFVSITQAFNTTTSMGRLTLNVLLSFAQFEREVIGERVRDKIAASKRKGLWMGGNAPLGYVSVNKKLEIVPDEAETVRGIFRRYLELRSIQALAEDLDKNAIRTKERTWSNERTIGGIRFGTGALAYLLKNRVYVGEVVHRGEIHRGDHAAILDRDTFEAVQEQLKTGAIDRKLFLKGLPSPLAGKIYDDRGNRMTPSHTVKKGVRYRYYISAAVLQKRKRDAGSVSRVPAPEIEELVFQALGAQMSHEGTVGGSDDDFLGRVERIVITSQVIKVYLAAAHDIGQVQVDQPPPISLPWTPQKVMSVKGVSLVQPEGESTLKAETRDALLTSIAKARSWVDELVADRITIEAIARGEGKGERHIRLLLPLAFTAPAVVEAASEGCMPASTTITGLATALPDSWAAQVRQPAAQ